MPFLETCQTLDDHKDYLSDPVRLEAYGRAIAEVVKPGDVVLDLGAGTAIFAMLACRAGAARVYAVDDGGVIEIGRAAAQANGYADHITFLCGHSTRIDLPEKCDVAVTEQMGGFGYEAGVVEFFNDARRRLLKPAAITIPRRIETFLAPVESPEAYALVEFWEQRRAGFDFSAARPFAANDEDFGYYEPQHLIGEARAAAEFDLDHVCPDIVALETELQITRAGLLHGLGGWFAAHLSANAILTNSPLAPQCMDRATAFFPLERPVPVTAGDRVAVAMRLVPAEEIVDWQVRVIGANGKLLGAFDQSSSRGDLVSREERARLAPGYAPRLGRHAEARRIVLNLCDGVATVDQIEREVARRYPEIFPSPRAVRRFVAETIREYAE
jgi:protein arginine N-methyltransferase 1